MMYEIIIYILIGLFAAVTITDSLYALICLSKTKADIDFVVMKWTVSLLIYVLTIVIPLAVILSDIFDKTHLSTLVITVVASLIFLPSVIAFNHGLPIGDYKWQQEQVGNTLKQKTIKF